MSRRLGLVSLVGLTACASSSNLEEELSRVRRDLAAMKKDLQDTQLSVQRLEGRITLLSLREQVDQPPVREVASAPAEITVAPETREDKAPAGKSSRAAAKKGDKPGDKPGDKRSAREATKAASVADARSQAKERVLPVVRLSGKAEARDEDDSNDPGALDDGSPPIVIQMGPEEGHESVPVDRDVLRRPDPVLGRVKEGADGARAREATSAEIEAEYSAALTKLRAEARPVEARLAFEAFRETHPRSTLAENALYWIGECHFAEKSYDRAVAAFTALGRQHPRSPKIPDALSRTAESWLALGDRPKAETVLKQIIEAYPKSEAAKGARARLESLSSSGGR